MEKQYTCGGDISSPNFSHKAPKDLQRLREVALAVGNVFAELVETVRHATLGEITRVLMEVGGRYRKMV